MNKALASRRGFFRQLASGLLVATAPALFLPKLVRPAWRPVKLAPFNRALAWYWCNMEMKIDSDTGLALMVNTYADGSQSVQAAYGVAGGAA